MYQTALYTFLVFAQVLWPSWVPVSIWLLEKDKQRKKILAGLMVMGCVAALYLGFCLTAFGVSANIAGNHIQYLLNFPKALKIPFSVFYFLPIVVSPFVSTVKRMGFLAVVAFVSYAIAQLFFDAYLISVWCFFAAIISVVVIWVERHLKQKHDRAMRLAALLSK